MRRVDEAVQQVLSEEIPKLKDPRIGFVTVTGARLTQDLEHADVWISVFGTERQRAASLEALTGAAGVLQGRINHQLRLRRVPVLRFHYDAAVERGVRLSHLIDELTPADEPAMPNEQADRKAVVTVLREHPRFLVTSHVNPDGDALGSLLAMHEALTGLGKDSVMMIGGPVALPGEYRFLELPARGLLRAAPPDAADRVVVAVDCAQASRIFDEDVARAARVLVNIDHHHDNTRFGSVNLVVEGATSTAEVLWDLFAELGVEMTPEIAEALYTGLVTDTGRFQYSNTTPRALRLAADLVEAGANVKRVFEAVYENQPYPKLKLLARALERATLHADGKVVVSYLVRQDFPDAGADEPYSEGVIDFLRAVEGSELAVLIREPPRDGVSYRKGSLRSSVDTLDVSAIARRFGGGGHRAAAGFETELSVEAATEQIVAAYLEQQAGE